MKYWVVALALACAWVPQAFAGNMVVAAAQNANPSVVTIELPADYIVVPVTIMSSEKEPHDELQAVQAAQAALNEAAAKHPGIEIRYGVQSLSFSREEGSFLSSTSDAASAQADLYVAVRLGKQKSVPQAARELVSFLRTIPKTGNAHLRFGSTALGLDSPDQYRPRLLQQIGKEVENTRNAVGKARGYRLGGMESPVQVAQRDGEHVIVFIPFRLELGQ